MAAMAAMAAAAGKMVGADRDEDAVRGCLRPGTVSRGGRKPVSHESGFSENNPVNLSPT